MSPQMSSKRKGKAVWVARDDYPGSRYECYRTKPEKVRGCHSGELVEHFWPNDFEKMFDYALSPGDCRKVRIVIEECK